MDQNKKKVLLIIIWWISAALLVAGGGWFWLYFKDYRQYSIYHNSQYRFTLRYPKTWQKLEDFPGSPVAFVCPKKTVLDVFQPNVNITIREVPPKITSLKMYSQTIAKQMTGFFKTNIIIVEDKDCHFANRSGHRLIVDTPAPNKLRIFFIWAIKGNFAYLFTFTAQQDRYKELESTLIKMTDSFELK